MLDRFFRDAAGQPHNRVNIDFHVGEMGISLDIAGDALTYLTSRGLVQRHNSDWLYLTERGIAASIQETDLTTLEPMNYASTPDGPHLVLITVDKQTVYPVTDQVVIGRALETDIPIDDKRASKRHAVIRHEGENYILEDLESANGTVVNGNYCVQPTELAHNDEIVIGRTMFVFQRTGLSVAEEESPSPVHPPQQEVSTDDVPPVLEPEYQSWPPPHSPTPGSLEPHIMEPSPPWPSYASPGSVQPASPVERWADNIHPNDEPPALAPRVLSRSRSGLDMEQAMEELRPTLISYDRPVHQKISNTPKVMEEPALPVAVVRDTRKASGSAAPSSLQAEENTSVDQPILEMPEAPADISKTIHSDPLPHMTASPTAEEEEAATADLPPLTREDFEAALRTNNHHQQPAVPAAPTAEWLTRLTEDLGRLRERARAAVGEKEPDHAVLLAINVLLTHPLVKGLAEAEDS
ncbi:MAG: FHA domain-containing protein [Myxococcales bacterium]|nr:FHA domain-containing protein [Myxococcales bacterium]